MPSKTTPERPKNPKRVLAGQRNQARRGPLTVQGREQLRAVVLANRPWDSSTGPRTKAGKARSAANGTYRQIYQLSIRQVRRELAEVRAEIDQARSLRLRIEANVAKDLS